MLRTMPFPTELCVEVVRHNFRTSERFFISADVERLFETFNVIELYTMTILQLTPRGGVLKNEHLDALARAYKVGSCASWSARDHVNFFDSTSWPA